MLKTMLKKIVRFSVRVATNSNIALFLDVASSSAAQRH
jgi:hypothetical protein